MKNTLNVIFSLVLTLALLLPLAACQPVETPSPSSVPAETPKPVVTSALTPTSPPEAAPVPKPTPKPETPNPATPKPSPSPTRKPQVTIVTPAPAPTQEPGLYRNDSFGFIFRYPPSWTLQETGARAPVARVSPQGFPFVQIDLNPTAETTTPTKYAQNYLTQFGAVWSQFKIEEQKEIKVGGADAYQAVFTFVSDAVTLKVKMNFFIRGSQAFQVYALGPRADFDRASQTIDDILNSFRLEEPKPFGVVRGQALTLVDNGPTTLDPAVSRESSSHSFITQVYSGLVSLDKKLNIVPALAERWEVSGEGSIYTFFLRKGAVFHNGKGVTAADFKYSWERAANPKTKSPTVETYLGDIVGVKDMMAGRAQEISGVKAVDDYTLQVTIDAPKAYFVSKLTYPTAFVVDRDNVESGEAEWWRRPNGTGPFKLLEWRKDELLILARNEQYYGEPAKIGNVVFRILGGRPMIMYENGEIDAAGVGVADIDRVKDPANPLSKELRVFPVVSLEYIAFSIDKPPFDDVKVRQAFSYAVDRDKIIQRILKGMNLKANGILPPGMPGHNPNLKGPEFDVNKARELIATSKYGSVASFPPIKLTIAGGSGDFADYLAAILQEWKQNLGVQVTVRQLDQDTFSYIIKEERDEMIIGGWVADYPDPENFLDVLFHTGSQANDSGYSNRDIDALLDKARVEQNAATRLKMYQEIEPKLLEDAAVLPLWYGTQYVLVKPYVRDYELSPLGYPLLEQVSLLAR